jgi:hypothetical protein
VFLFVDSLLFSAVTVVVRYSLKEDNVTKIIVLFQIYSEFSFIFFRNIKVPKHNKKKEKNEPLDLKRIVSHCTNKETHYHLYQKHNKKKEKNEPLDLKRIVSHCTNKETHYHLKDQISCKSYGYLKSIVVLLVVDNLISLTSLLLVDHHLYLLASLLKRLKR